MNCAIVKTSDPARHPRVHATTASAIDPVLLKPCLKCGFEESVCREVKRLPWRAQDFMNDGRYFTSKRRECVARLVFPCGIFIIRRRLVSFALSLCAAGVHATTSFFDTLNRSAVGEGSTGSRSSALFCSATHSGSCPRHDLAG